MIRGEHIVCAAPEPWKHIWRNRHQIMSRLARENKVLFVEPRPYLREVIQGVRRGEIALGDFFRARTEEVRKNLWAYRPPLYAPLSGRFPLNVTTRWLREFDLRQTMRQLGFSEPILWLVRPNMADMVGTLGEKLVVYHVVDQYAAYDADYDSSYGAERRAAVEASERHMLSLADLVIVTSRSLIEEKSAHNDNVHWVPNGVDYQRFSSAGALDKAPPEDMAGLPKPIVGYVGAINEKLDYDLLRLVAQNISGTLVLVGPVLLRLDLSGQQALDLPNVRFLGNKPVAQVADYVATCDVCLMPYTLNEWTAHINPLKLFEYLAAGKPIVSTAIPAVQGFEDVVRVAGNEAEFLAHIREALIEDNQAAIAQRRAVASENTWEARVERISKLLEASLARTRPRAAASAS